MPILATPEDVVRRADIRSHPEYEDISPMDDCAGFYAYRRYPADTELAELVTNDGRPAVRCYLRFVVERPVQGSHVSPVDLKALVWPSLAAERRIVFRQRSGPAGPS